ncbi:MAG: hypothetical protein AB7Q92_01480 [Acidimicrobiia bacterium]
MLTVRRRPQGAPGRRTAWMGASWMVAAVCSVGALAVVAVGGAGGADREGELAGAATPTGAPAAKSAEDAAGATKPRESVGDAAGTEAASGGTGSVTASTASEQAPAGSGTGDAGSGAGADNAGADGAGASGEQPAGSATGNGGAAPAGTAGSGVGATGGTSPSGAPVVLGSSQCSDPDGEATTENLGDMDLRAVELQREAGGLRVRFRLDGAVQADAGLTGGAPATNLWQLLLASGDEVLYAFSVTEHGTVWETSLVDFASASGDRLGTIAAQSGDVVEALIPNEHLSRLPASFTWWALTNTDRQPPAGPYIGDDCPNGTGDLDPTQLLPPENSRAVYYG